MKKVLITGSSGYSGSQIAALLANEFQIKGVDLVEGTYTTHIGSLTDQDFINTLLQGVDIIIHTASLHAPHIATHTRKDFIDTNITGTLNLLEAAKQYQVEKFVYTSTTSLYGESMDDATKAVWITEEVPTIPRDIYDITKIAAEGLCRDFFVPKGMQTVVLRTSRFWKEPMDKKVFYRMYRGVDVRDVALAHQLAIEHSFDHFEIFNISAQSIFIKDDLFDLKNNTAHLLRTKIPALFAYYNKRNWEMPSSIDRVYVIDKAKEMLGYQPKYNIKEMLQES